MDFSHNCVLSKVYRTLPADWFSDSQTSTEEVSQSDTIEIVPDTFDVAEKLISASDRTQIQTSSSLLFLLTRQNFNFQRSNVTEYIGSMHAFYLKSLDEVKSYYLDQIQYANVTNTVLTARYFLKLLRRYLSDIYDDISRQGPPPDFDFENHRKKVIGELDELINDMQKMVQFFTAIEGTETSETMETTEEET